MNDCGRKNAQENLYKNLKSHGEKCAWVKVDLIKLRRGGQRRLRIRSPSRHYDSESKLIGNVPSDLQDSVSQLSLGLVMETRASDRARSETSLGMTCTMKKILATWKRNMPGREMKRVLTNQNQI